MRPLSVTIASLVLGSAAVAAGSGEPSDITAQKRPSRQHRNRVEPDDGLVSHSEAKAASGDVHPRASVRRFDHVDRNDDGKIGKREAARHKLELARKQRARQVFDALRREHGDQKLASAAWLAHHPGVVEALADNHEFLSRHPRVLAALQKDRRFAAEHLELARRIARKQRDAQHADAVDRVRDRRAFAHHHPDAAKALGRNRHFASEHPHAARKLADRREKSADRRIAVGQENVPGRFSREHSVAACTAVRHHAVVKHVAARKHAP
jgi:hypothetical protein